MVDFSGIRSYAYGSPELEKEQSSFADSSSAVARGFGAGVAGLGYALEDTVGVGQTLADYGTSLVERNPSPYQTPSDIIDDPLGWGASLLGEQTANLAVAIPSAIGLGAAGAAVGGPVGGAIGAGAGLFAPSFIQEYGGARISQEQQGFSDPSRAALGAGAVAAIDVAAGPARLLTRGIAHGAQALARDGGEALWRASGKQGIEEAVTEAAQVPFSRYGAGLEQTGEDALNDYIMSTAGGFVGGTVIGGGLRALGGRRPQELPPLADQPSADILAGTTEYQDPFQPQETPGYTINPFVRSGVSPNITMPARQRNAAGGFNVYDPTLADVVDPSTLQPGLPWTVQNPFVQASQVPPLAGFIDPQLGQQVPPPPSTENPYIVAGPSEVQTALAGGTADTAGDAFDLRTISTRLRNAAGKMDQTTIKLAKALEGALRAGNPDVATDILTEQLEAPTKAGSATIQARGRAFDEADKIIAEYRQNSVRLAAERAASRPGVEVARAGDTIAVSQPGAGAYVNMAETRPSDTERQIREANAAQQQTEQFDNALVTANQIGQESIETRGADQTARLRQSILDTVLGDPATQNPASRFKAELRRNKIYNTTLTPAEFESIGRFIDAREATQPGTQMEMRETQRLQQAPAGLETVPEPVTGIPEAQGELFPRAETPQDFPRVQPRAAKAAPAQSGKRQSRVAERNTLRSRIITLRDAGTIDAARARTLEDDLTRGIDDRFLDAELTKLEATAAPAQPAEEQTENWFNPVSYMTAVNREAAGVSKHTGVRKQFQDAASEAVGLKEMRSQEDINALGKQEKAAYKAGWEFARRYKDENDPAKVKVREAEAARVGELDQLEADALEAFDNAEIPLAEYQQMVNSIEAIRQGELDMEPSELRGALEDIQSKSPGGRLRQLESDIDNEVANGLISPAAKRAIMRMAAPGDKPTTESVDAADAMFSEALGTAIEKQRTEADEDTETSPDDPQELDFDEDGVARQVENRPTRRDVVKGIVLRKRHG